MSKIDNSEIYNIDIVLEKNRELLNYCFELETINETQILLYKNEIAELKNRPSQQAPFFILILLTFFTLIL